MKQGEATKEQKLELLEKVVAKLRPEIHKFEKQFSKEKTKHLERIKHRINEATKQRNFEVQKGLEKELVRIEAQDPHVMAEGLVRWHLGLHVIGLKIEGMPFAKRVDKKGRIKLARSIKEDGKVRTEYVGLQPQEELFLYLDKQGTEKLVSFSKTALRYNKVDLFKFWVYGGLYEGKDVPAIRNDWDWKIICKSEHEAFSLFWEILKGEIPLLNELKNEKKFNHKVRIETSSF